MLLRQFGCEALAAHDHHSALQIISDHEVDLLVIDYHLAAGETGEAIARDVRVMRPNVPMIMLTGDSRVPESAANSVDAVIVKGCSTPGALLDLIQKLIPDAQLKPRRPNLFSETPGKSS